MSSHCTTEPKPVANPAESPSQEQEQKKPVALGMWVRALPVLIELLDEVWRRSLVMQPAVARRMCPRAACQPPPDILMVRQSLIFKQYSTECSSIGASVRHPTGTHEQGGRDNQGQGGRTAHADVSNWLTGATF